MPYLFDDGGTGTTTNIDSGARNLIAQLLATPGTTADIQPGDGIVSDGKQWQNQTGAAIPVPNPATEAGMLGAGFTDVTAGGATDSLNNVGPWTGTANAGDKFGLDPATGNRYYVDTGGNWQPAPSGSLLNTVGPWTGAAPAGDQYGFNPATGDQYYVDNAGNWQPIQSGGLVAPTQSIDQTGTFAPPVAPYHTQPYVVDTTGTADGNDPALPAGNQDYVDMPLSAPTAAGQWIQITRDGPNTILINGTVDGDATGIYHNLDRHRLDLYSSDGATWSSYRNV